jgi:hypothetical protein
MTDKDFLASVAHFQERAAAGVDCHLSDVEAERFEKIALSISPNGEFSWRGCLECKNHLVNFVFNNFNKSNNGSKKSLKDQPDETGE